MTRLGLAARILAAAVSALTLVRAGLADAAVATPAAAIVVAAPKATAPATPIVITPPTPDAAWQADQQVLTQLQGQAQLTSDDGRLGALASRVSQIEASSQSAIASLSAQIAGVDHAIAAASPNARHPVTAAQKAKLAPLQSQRAALAGQLAEAQNVAAAATSAFDSIAERRREGFSARVLERSASPLEPSFWSSLAGDADEDFGRLLGLVREAGAIALAAPEPRGLGGLIGGALLALLLAFPLRAQLEKLGRRKAGEAVHPGFARTGAALWVAAVDIALPTLAAVSLRFGAEWGGLLSHPADIVSRAAVVAVAWASAILALSRVLATDCEGAHRLLPVSDHTAARLRGPMLAVALVAASGFVLTQVNYVAGASVAATIAANCVLSLAYAAVAALILISFGRSQTLAEPTPDTDAAAATSAVGQPAPAWTFISLMLSGAIVVTLVAVLSGYTTLAAVTSGQIFWLSIIAAVAFLLLRFVDDAVSALFRRGGWAATSLQALFNFRRATIRQLGVLISAGLQLLILVAALSFALTPFGRSGDLLAADLGKLGGAFKLGSATISPAAIAAGVAALAVGMVLVRMVQGWIDRRYLPATDWDLGLRNSVSTGVGYIGVCLALLSAFWAMGLDFSQIALIASALSVGIGFGLQQVVQNFVSGVILLVERPVKVGDWVHIDGIEGDIRRIRVRATEIQLSDRSTVIVPNSDLITKAVKNRTLNDIHGRIEMKLAIARPGDARKTKALILQAAKTDPRILQEPPPAIYIDSMTDNGGVSFTCYLYVEDPRKGASIRSDLFFALVDLLESGKIEFDKAA